MPVRAFGAHRHIGAVSLQSVGNTQKRRTEGGTAWRGQHLTTRLWPSTTSLLLRAAGLSTASEIVSGFLEAWQFDNNLDKYRIPLDSTSVTVVHGYDQSCQTEVLVRHRTLIT